MLGFDPDIGRWDHFKVLKCMLHRTLLHADLLVHVLRQVARPNECLSTVRAAADLPTLVLNLSYVTSVPGILN